MPRHTALQVVQEVQRALATEVKRAGRQMAMFSCAAAFLMVCYSCFAGAGAAMLGCCVGDMSRQMGLSWMCRLLNSMLQHCQQVCKHEHHATEHMQYSACAVNSCGRRWPSWSWSRAAQSSGYLGPGDMHPCSADSELSVWHSCTPCAFSAWDKRPVSTRGHVQTRAGTWWLHGRVRTCELRVSGAKQHLSP